MKDLLHPRHRGAIARFLGTPLSPRRVLLAFDYDGVLAPLVKRPSGAKMRPQTRALLRRVVRLYPVGWRRRLERDLRDVEGIHFEDKRSTLAVHYGLARDRTGAERAVYEAANQLEGTRLIAGKRVLNVLPHDFPTKGDAVRALVARLGCDGAVVLGDDVTDEDAFAVGAPLVFGVHVGKGPSLAPWRLGAQADVDELLRIFIAARTVAPAPARARTGVRGGERSPARRAAR